MWELILAYAKLFDVIMVAACVIAAMVAAWRGQWDRATFWMVSALFWGRGQGKQ